MVFQRVRENMNETIKPLKVEFPRDGIDLLESRVPIGLCVRFGQRMSVLTLNWVRLAPKWDKSGTFKDQFQYILARFGSTL